MPDIDIFQQPSEMFCGEIIANLMHTYSSNLVNIKFIILIKTFDSLFKIKHQHSALVNSKVFLSTTVHISILGSNYYY